MNTNTDGNISFFLEDYEVDDLEDNNNILEKLMHDFENTVIEDQDDTMVMNINNNLLYFAKKSIYDGNEELYYDKEYTTKELLKICQYYGIAKNIKAAKCKKIDIITTIIYFENCFENTNIVKKRHTMWAYMTEMLADHKMKCYLLW
jgi:hypothetical protein